MEAARGAKLGVGVPSRVIQRALVKGFRSSSGRCRIWPRLKEAGRA